MLTSVRCPTCRTRTPWADNPSRPFCSERCRLLDLGRWADEAYRIPGPAASTGSGADSEDDPLDKH